MLSEEAKDSMIDSLSEIDYIYDSQYFDVPIFRSDEDVPTEPQLIVVSFIPSSRKIGMSLNNYLGRRENVNYSDFGYGEYERVVVRVLSENVSGLDGRAMAQKWMSDIETYIKNYWDNLITGGSVDKYSFGHNAISNPFVRRQYGYEVSFDVITSTTWTDEPASGAVSPVDVSGIEVVADVEVWVSI